MIVYGTRTGTTANTSEIMAETLRQQGTEVKVINAKEEKVQSIKEFDLVVGSGIQIGKWTSEPEDFIKKHQKELSTKKFALFVSCGGANSLSEGEKKTKECDDAKRKYLEDKAVELKVTPVALGFFKGCYDFNKMSWFFKKTLESIKPKLEGVGYKESEAGVYDLRDLVAIRNWTRELTMG